MSGEDPIYMPRTGHSMFKVCVYNRVVRAMVKANKHHVNYDDDWAEVHCQRVSARSAEQARNLAETRYPPQDGFVITDVVPLAMA